MQQDEDFQRWLKTDKLWRRGLALFLKTARASQNRSGAALDQAFPPQNPVIAVRTQR